MPDLIPRPTMTMAHSRVARVAARELEAVRAEAAIRSARVDGAALLTHVAMSHLTMLSKLEEQSIKHAPLSSSRCQALIDAYASFAASEIMRYGR